MGEGMDLENQEAEALVGQIVGNGKYELTGLIGGGGMALVFEAANRQLHGRKVAIKTLRHNMAQVADIQVRFQREVEAMAKLHVNVASVLDFGEDQLLGYYMVMELLQGTTLAALLRDGPIRDHRKVITIALQVALALSDAHVLDIVHRDLKPDNIFLVPNGDQEQVKVVDFGIALVSATENEIDKRLTKAGAIFGTPRYMSPEQAAGKDVDWRADIYALGIILYEMVTGRAPFEGDSLVEVLNAQITQAPPALRDSDPNLEISPYLEAIIWRAMAKDPSERFIDMAEMHSALEAALDAMAPVSLPSVEPVRTSQPVQAPSVRPAKRVYQTPARQPKQRSRRALALIVALTALIIGVLAIKMIANLSPAEPDPETPAANAADRSSTPGASPSSGTSARPSYRGRPTRRGSRPARSAGDPYYPQSNSDEP